LGQALKRSIDFMVGASFQHLNLDAKSGSRRQQVSRYVARGRAPDLEGATTERWPDQDTVVVAGGLGGRSLSSSPPVAYNFK
jgi:hypothetical protein